MPSLARPDDAPVLDTGLASSREKGRLLSPRDPRVPPGGAKVSVSRSWQVRIPRLPRWAGSRVLSGGRSAPPLQPGWGDETCRRVVTPFGRAPWSWCARRMRPDLRHSARAEERHDAAARCRRRDHGRRYACELGPHGPLRRGGRAALRDGQRRGAHSFDPASCRPSPRSRPSARCIARPTAAPGLARIRWPSTAAPSPG